MCAGNSLVKLPPSVKPHSSSARSPPSLMRTRPRFTSGAYCTFLKYLPVPVTRKYLPSSSGARKPVGILRMGAASRSRKSRRSASSSISDTLPPLRSSQPWAYMFVSVRTISTIKGAVRISFIVYASLSVNWIFRLPRHVASMGRATTRLPVASAVSRFR